LKLHFLIGASIKAARNCSRHILALDGEKKIFDLVLKQLHSPPSLSKNLDVDFSGHIVDLDDDFATPDIELDNLCK
jgi:hypothetical protein